MKTIFIVLKGFLMGLADLVPGISGGTIALCLGIYEKIINIINNLLKNIKENLKFMVPLIIGIGLALLLMSKVIKYTLNVYPLATVMLFIGLILGGFPILFNKVKPHISKKSNILVIVITMVFVISISLLSSNNMVNFSNMKIIDYLLLALVGAVGSCTLVIPGISGSFVLLLLGYYKPIISVVSDLTNLNHFWANMAILVPFGIGFVIGIFLIARVIGYFFKNYETKTYSAIVGFILASIIGIFVNIPMTFNILEFIVGVCLFIIGFIVSKKVGSVE